MDDAFVDDPYAPDTDDELTKPARTEGDELEDDGETEPTADAEAEEDLYG